MARPREIVKRDSRIQVRCTALEKKAIEIMAEETGLNTSDFVRKCAMNKTVKIRFTPEELEHFKTFQKYHENFRRIANIIRNTKGVSEQLLQEISETQQLIKEQLKRFES